jgi:hypothetical protein
MPHITELIKEGLSDPVDLEKQAQERLKNELGIKSKNRKNRKNKISSEFFELKEKPTLKSEVIIPFEAQILYKDHYSGLFNIDERRTNVGFNKGPPKPLTPPKHKTPILDAFNKVKRYGKLKANKIARRAHRVTEAVRYELNKFELFPKKQLSEQEKLLAQNRILASKQRSTFLKERKIFTDEAIKLDSKYRMRCHHQETGEDNDISDEYRANNINYTTVENQIHSPRYEEYFSKDALDVQIFNKNRYVAGYLSNYKGQDKIFPLNSHPNTLKAITKHIHTIEKPDYPEKILLSNVSSKDNEKKSQIRERKKRTANRYFKKKNFDFGRHRMEYQMESESETNSFNQIHNPDYNYQTKDKKRRKADYKEKIRYYRLTGNTNPLKPERERGHDPNIAIGRDNAYLNTREERHLKNYHDRHYNEKKNKEIVHSEGYLFDRKFIDNNGLVNYNSAFDDDPRNLKFKRPEKIVENSINDDNKENSFISSRNSNSKDSKKSQVFLGDSRTLNSSASDTFINKIDNYSSSFQQESLEEKTSRKSKSNMNYLCYYLF